MNDKIINANIFMNDDSVMYHDPGYGGDDGDNDYDMFY